MNHKLIRDGCLPRSASDTPTFSLLIERGNKGRSNTVRGSGTIEGEASSPKKDTVVDFDQKSDKRFSSTNERRSGYLGSTLVRCSGDFLDSKLSVLRRSLKDANFFEF